MKTFDHFKMKLICVLVSIAYSPGFSSNIQNRQKGGIGNSETCHSFLERVTVSYSQKIPTLKLSSEQGIIHPGWPKMLILQFPWKTAYPTISYSFIDSEKCKKTLA